MMNDQQASLRESYIILFTYVNVVNESSLPCLFHGVRSLLKSNRNIFCFVLFMSSLLFSFSISYVGLVASLFCCLLFPIIWM